MAILVIAILAAVSLLITPNLHLFFDVTPKAAVLIVGAAVSLALVVWGRVEIRSLIGQRYGKWFCGLIVTAGISVMVSALFSQHREFSFGGGNWRRFGLLEQLALLCFVFVTACWLSGRPARLRLLMRAFVVCGLCAGAYGIAQYFGFDPWLSKVGYQAGEGQWTIVRPPSTFGHANYFATWLLFPVFAGVGLALADNRRLWRSLGVACFAVGLVAIVMSGTRSALLGFVIGAGLLAIWNGLKLARKTALLLLLVAAASVVFYLSPPGEMLRRRVHWIKEDPLGGARVWLWRDSLTMSAQQLLVGFGPETFALEFPRFQSVELSRAYPGYYHESPHNVLLDSLTQQGVPGLLILLGLIGVGIASGVRGRQKALCAALLAALASLQFSVFVVPTALFFYLTIAILISSSAKGADSTPRMHRWIALPVLLLCVLMVYVGARIWIADVFLQKTADALQRGEMQSAASEFKKANKWGARADLWYSRSMALAAQKTRDPVQRTWAWKEALDAAVRATQTSDDRQNAWYNLAAFQAGRNDFAGTERSLRNAIECSPNWFKAHWMLARFLQATGRLPEAEKEAERAAFLDAGKDPEVDLTLHQVRTSLRSANNK
jgi:O-antigen ligase